MPAPRFSLLSASGTVPARHIARARGWRGRAHIPYLIFLPAVVLSLLLWNKSKVRAQDYPAHPHVVVFIPAYEGSKLHDPALARPDGKDGPDGPCVWGTLDAIRKKEYYYALRMPNQLVARPMLKAGPLDIYDTFVAALTSPAPAEPAAPREASPARGGTSKRKGAREGKGSAAEHRHPAPQGDGQGAAGADAGEAPRRPGTSRPSQRIGAGASATTTSSPAPVPRAARGDRAERSAAPAFTPYTLGKDFFIFSYDWRQDIATGTAPHLYIALQSYAATYARATGADPDTVRFVLVAHSMGGLVVRTMLGQQPRFGDRIERAVLVGTPNLGSVKALKTLLVGPGGLRESELTWPSNLLKLLPNEITPAVSKLVAITRPSLYELLPLRDPRWIRIDDQGATTRVSADDLLTLGTWAPFWPTADEERREYLTPYRARFRTGDEPTEPAAWEFCQDPMMPNLQDILAKVREWRLQLGTLAYSSQLLTRPGQAPRLSVVVTRGLRTPTGVTSEGLGPLTTARYTYEEGADGDETVTVESAIEDLPADSPQIVWLDKVPHGAQMNSPQFLTWLRRELAQLSAAGPALPPAEKAGAAR